MNLQFFFPKCQCRKSGAEQTVEPQPGSARQGQAGLVSFAWALSSAGWLGFFTYFQNHRTSYSKSWENQKLTPELLKAALL